MRKYLLLFLAVTSTSFSLTPLESLQENNLLNKCNPLTYEILTQGEQDYSASKPPILPLSDIKEMLQKKASTLSPIVIDKVITTLNCAQENQVAHNNILTIIDYSLPSSEKRLWVFDLKKKKLLFYTYVAHGINSGQLLSNYFSNKYNSKASSIGVYKTEESYYGREGLSLRLDGLDATFNDNAGNRSVVMHAGWYVEEDFIKKYGRAGRSWGCPALPHHLSNSIINTIKDNSLFVIYYPSEDWFAKSKFLNCHIPSSLPESQQLATTTKPMVQDNTPREDILFADLNRNNRREENDPILVVTADNYERMFHMRPPLTRMLRRQIDHAEYIALSNTELENLIANHSTENGLNLAYFVIPVIKMIRGYYETQMKIVNLGKIKEVQLTSSSSTKNYTVHFETEKPVVTLKSTNQFIRWLGL